MARSQRGSRRRRPADRDHVPSGTWRPCMHLWIDIKGRGSLGPGKLRLLRAVAARHSLAAAARELRMSYRLAWQHLRLIEQRTGISVVERHRGGSTGGGTVLTPQGRLLVEAYQGFHRELERYMCRVFRRFFAGWHSP